MQTLDFDIHAIDLADRVECLILADRLADLGRGGEAAVLRDENAVPVVLVTGDVRDAVQDAEDARQAALTTWGKTIPRSRFRIAAVLAADALADSAMGCLVRGEFAEARRFADEAVARYPQKAAGFTHMVQFVWVVREAARQHAKGTP